jgi:hypothetical protein
VMKTICDALEGADPLQPPSPSWGGTAGAERRQGGEVRSVNDSRQVYRTASDIPTRSALRPCSPHEGEGGLCPAPLPQGGGE